MQYCFIYPFRNWSHFYTTIEDHFSRNHGTNSIYQTSLTQGTINNAATIEKTDLLHLHSGLSVVLYSCINQ